VDLELNLLARPTTEVWGGCATGDALASVEIAHGDVAAVRFGGPSSFGGEDVGQRQASAQNPVEVEPIAGDDASGAAALERRQAVGREPRVAHEQPAGPPCFAGDLVVRIGELGAARRARFVILASRRCVCPSSAKLPSICSPTSRNDASRQVKKESNSAFSSFSKANPRRFRSTVSCREHPSSRQRKRREAFASEHCPTH
jgi:hypothetical protein